MSTLTRAPRRVRSPTRGLITDSLHCLEVYLLKEVLAYALGFSKLFQILPVDLQFRDSPLVLPELWKSAGYVKVFTESLMWPVVFGSAR